jgi:predicted RNA-binding protein YlxR (DUF448 family)
MKAPRPRKVPQRTCVGCRTVQGKRELVRVVRTPEGEVVVDPTGKRNGRGAYVHRSPECVELALKRGGLERGLNVKLTPEIRATLEELARPSASAPHEAASSPEGAKSERPEQEGGSER